MKSRMKRVAEIFLDRQGFEVVERDFRFGSDGIIEFVAKDSDEDGNILVFIRLFWSDKPDNGFPDEDMERASLELGAVSYLAQHFEEDCQFRFDALSIILVSEGAAAVRHHINVFGDDHVE